MPEFCTCGAELPPDARFCHKCGKPQRDEPVVVEEPPVFVAPPVAAPVVPPPPPPIDFKNATALRVAILGALMSSLLNVLLIYGFPLWLALAGFFCVSVYRRRTGVALTVGAGVRMGWITGLFSYLIFATLFTLTFVQQVRSGELVKNMQEMPYFRGSAEQLRQVLADPVMLALNVVFSLVALLVLFTGFSIAGGALGAKTLKKE